MRTGTEEVRPVGAATGDPEAPPALVLDGIGKSFGGLAVLEAVSLTVRPGEIFGIAGPNGAGKTTLLNIVSGVLPASAGEITAGGVACTGYSTSRMASLGVARTFQNIRLFRGLTVVEQVLAGGYRHRRASVIAGMLGTRAAREEERRARDEALELLDRMGIAEHADVLAEGLPYGLQRRVEIARALATRPATLLLDEPTAGMNASDWGSIAELLRRLRGTGMALVVVEHNMRLIEAVCDRVAVIDAGNVIACDVPRVALAEPAVRVAYFGK
jgi:branched-chain amino acid transport system ATP-binding protein